MDNNNMMPELTLTPFADKPVEKPAEPEVPAAQDAEKDLGVTLTPEEKKMVADFAAKIDITDPNIVLQYARAPSRRSRTSRTARSRTSRQRTSARSAT